MGDNGVLHTQSIHVVMFCYPGQGHINPFMQLARKMAAEGVMVTFVNTEYYIERMIRSHDSGFQQEQADSGIRLVGLSDGLPHDNPRKNDDLQVVIAYQSMGSAFEELLRRLLQEGLTISCIIMDPFLRFLRDVATKFKCPQALFWTTAASVFSMHWHTELLMDRGILPIKEPKELIDCISGVRPFNPADLPTSMLLETSSHEFEFFRKQFDCITDEDWILVNSFYELEGRAVDALQAKTRNFLTVGPLLPLIFDQSNLKSQTKIGASLWTEDDDCFQWLDNQDENSVLYVSFGTVVQLEADLLQQLAMGLRATKQPFLWSLRSDSVKDHDLLSIMERFLVDTHEQGLVVSWVSQPSVLSHPAVGGFLTHCGWNSVLESICAGVPMIGFPGGKDQIPICRVILQEHGIVMELRAGEEGKLQRNVEAAVEAVMQGDEGKAMRERILHLRNAAEMSACEGGSSHKNLEAFLEGIRKVGKTEV